MIPLPNLTSFARRGERYVADPLVTFVLGSRFHPLLSDRLLLLSYEGRRSGRRFTTPTCYRLLDGGSEAGNERHEGNDERPEEEGGRSEGNDEASHASGVVLFTPATKTDWWKNFRGGHPCRVLVRGEWHEGRGEAVVDDAAVLRQLRRVSVVRGACRWRRRLPGQRGPSGARLRRLAEGLVVVRVRLDSARYVEK